MAVISALNRWWCNRITLNSEVTCKLQLLFCFCLNSFRRGESPWWFFFFFKYYISGFLYFLNSWYISLVLFCFWSINHRSIQIFFLFLWQALRIVTLNHQSFHEFVSLLQALSALRHIECKERIKPISSKVSLYPTEINLVLYLPRKQLLLLLCVCGQKS